MKPAGLVHINVIFRRMMIKFFKSAAVFLSEFRFLTVSPEFTILIKILTLQIHLLSVRRQILLTLFSVRFLMMSMTLKISIDVQILLFWLFLKLSISITKSTGPKIPAASRSRLLRGDFVDTKRNTCFDELHIQHQKSGRTGTETATE